MNEYDQTLRQTLLQTAARSIRHGLQHQRPLQPEPDAYPPELQALRACFVTLELHGQLRGCIGNLQAVQPLIVDVASNAYAAAFSDPRFPPLREAEYPELMLHISVLSEPEPLQVESRQELLAQLRPGVDGLILQQGPNRATFLPSVWEQLPRAEEFVAHLLRKAGLRAGHWSPEMRVSRYTSESFGAPIGTVQD